MTRTPTTYGDRKAAPRPVRGAIDVSQPVAGFYRFRLRAGGVYGGVRVWYGPPLDPVTGEELDRSLRWQATFNGEPVDLDRVWPACAREPITEAECRQYAQRQAWAQDHAPDSAYANSRRKVDRLSRSEVLPF